MKSNEIALQKAGLRRFSTGAEFDKDINEKADLAVKRMLNNLPDNYPNTEFSRISSVFRSFSEERERMISCLYAIGDDQFYGNTRPEYLFQILGDLLFLNGKSAGTQYTDYTYRDFLLKVKNAYLKGSGKDSIQESLSDIIGFPVILRELYKESRLTNSPTSIKDTHKIIAEIFMDVATQDQLTNLSTVIQDLYFFIALIKPAHTLFDTRLIFADSFNISNCSYTDFATDANGNVFNYEYVTLDHSVYALSKMSKFTGDPTESQLIKSNWISGIVAGIDTNLGVITLADGTELVISSLSFFYDRDVDGDYRIELEGISIGDPVWFFGYKAPGEFKFESPVAAVEDNWYKQFDPLTIMSSEFQGKVVRALQGDTPFPEIIKGCDSSMSVAEADYTLLEQYEDLRDNCEFPSPMPYSAYFYGPSVVPGSEGPNYKDVKAHLSATDDPNVYILDPHPVINKSGLPATVSDIIVFVDNVLMTGAVAAINASTGEITLNFILPALSTLRVDFYYRNIYPLARTENFVRYATNTAPGSNVGGFVAISPAGLGYPVVFFQWPFKQDQEEFYGNDGSYQMEHFPLLNSSGNLATIDDIQVSVDGLPISNCITFIRPLLGHVQLNFIAPAESSVTFTYMYQPKKRSYAMVTDSVQHLSDTVYGPRSAYSLLTDPSDFTDYTLPIGSTTLPAKYGYRYRAFDLGSSSVWDSEDTFRTDDYTIPSVKGSYAGTHSKLSNYRLVFSPEYLYDTNKNVVLDDKYLTNHLVALTQLGKGTPPFYRSFTSLGQFIYQTPVEPTASTYQSALPGAFDVAAGLSINATASGLIEYVPLPEAVEKERLKVLAGLLEHVDVTGDETIEISSICEDRGMSLNLNIDEEYYPNRELRLNDYKDYVDRLSADAVTGELQAIKGSDLVKKSAGSWAYVRVGSDLKVGSRTYAVRSVPNSYTIRISPRFSEASGRYPYELIFNYVDKPAVLLNEVVRRKRLNVLELMPYYQGTGNPSYTPWLIDTSFADPDPDPYPRNAYGVAGTPPLLTSQIGDENGQIGLLQTAAEAETLVKFRNWDQELFFVNPGLMQEHFLEPMDDTLNDGVRMLFWDVNLQDYVWYSFRGLVIISTEQVGVVNASSYPTGVIRLVDQYDSTGRADAQYMLLNTIVRQILPDNSVDIIAIDEFVRL